MAKCLWIRHLRPTRCSEEMGQGREPGPRKTRNAWSHRAPPFLWGGGDLLPGYPLASVPLVLLSWTPLTPSLRPFIVTPGYQPAWAVCFSSLVCLDLYDNCIFLNFLLTLNYFLIHACGAQWKKYKREWKGSPWASAPSPTGSHRQRSLPSRDAVHTRRSLLISTNKAGSYFDSWII